MKANDGAGEDDEVRDLKRGPKAWANAGDCSLDMNATRMLAHTVADSTGLDRYLKAVSRWLVFVKEHELPCVTWEERDKAMGLFCAYVLYIKNEKAHVGDCLLNGITYIWPESANHLPRGWRCLKGWHRVTIDGVRDPIPDESLACIEAQLRAEGEEEAADVVVLSVDCYLRGQDWQNLKSEDVVEDEVDDETVLFLGRAHRGESAKTGREQGVRIDWGYVRDLIRRRLGVIEQRHGPNDRDRVNVFSIRRLTP